MNDLIPKHEAELHRISAVILDLSERRKELQTILATLRAVEKDNAAARAAEAAKEK